MKNFAMVLVFAVACGRGGGDEIKGTPEANQQKATPSGTVAAAAPRKVWPKAVCSIVAADAVSAVVGSP
jgi:hypothetical protein